MSVKTCLSPLSGITCAYTYGSLLGRLINGVSGNGLGYIGRISDIYIIMKSFPIYTLDTDVACYVVGIDHWCE
jgi:hypothetical protein